MKKLFLLIFIIGCNNQRPIFENESNLPGIHELRKMFTRDILKSHPGSVSGFFFFGLGGMSGQEGSQEIDRVVSFAWKNNKDEYIISTLPIKIIRISFDDSIAIPTVKFRWTPAYQATTEIDRLIIYAVITCHSRDWPQDITMPDLKNKLSAKP